MTLLCTSLRPLHSEATVFPTSPIELGNSVRSLRDIDVVRTFAVSKT